MSDSKYVKNRNLWRRVYPRTRQKPRLLDIVEPTGISASIDLTRQHRTRDFFEYKVPALGQLVIPPIPPSILSVCFAFPSGGGNWIASLESTIILTGSNVGFWQAVETEASPGETTLLGNPLRQTTLSRQPAYELLSTGSFVNLPALTFAGSQNLVQDDPLYADFMYLSGGANIGGTSISVVQVPGNFTESNSVIWSNQFKAQGGGGATRGGNLRQHLRENGDNITWTLGVGFGGGDGPVDSDDFVVPTTPRNVVAIARSNPVAQSGSMRVNGHEKATNLALWSTALSNVSLTIGSLVDNTLFYSGSIYYQAFIPRVLSDEECECIENWANGIWGTSGSLTILP